MKTFATLTLALMLGAAGTAVNAQDQGAQSSPPSTADSAQSTPPSDQAPPSTPDGSDTAQTPPSQAGDASTATSSDTGAGGHDADVKTKGKKHKDKKAD